MAAFEAAFPDAELLGLLSVIGLSLLLDLSVVDALDVLLEVDVFAFDLSGFASDCEVPVFASELLVFLASFGLAADALD